MHHQTHLAACPSPVGLLTLASDGENLTGLWLENQKYFGSTLAPDAQPGALPVFAQAFDWLARYFRGEAPAMTLPLAPAGSPFRQAVWDILRRIPYGETTTYGRIATQLERQTGRRASAQAVGGAVGHNPISILIPCHRVLGADGGLTGYAGGLDVKARLLTLEGARFRL